MSQYVHDRDYCGKCNAHAEDLLDEMDDRDHLFLEPLERAHPLSNQSDGERPMRGDDL